MADGNEVPTGEAGAEKPRRGLIVPLLAALVGSGIGGAAGTLFVGPALGPALAARAQEGGGGKGGHEGGGETTLRTLENLVVNPAGSEGTRYLLVSVAVQVAEPDQVEVLAARDVALRHALLQSLGAKTVKELADIEKRPALVQELKETLSEVLGDEVEITQIYLPQYVIQ